MRISRPERSFQDIYQWRAPRQSEYRPKDLHPLSLHRTNRHSRRLEPRPYLMRVGPLL